MKDFISVVIPVYNSDNSLWELSVSIKRVFKELQDFKYEIIFVDDASPNKKTWQSLEKIAQKDDSVKSMQLTRNFGQQIATFCGIKEAKGDFVITMDDDLQHDPKDIKNLLSRKEHDIVIVQFKNKKHSYFKKITSNIKGWFDYILIGKPKHIQLTPYRMIKRCVVDGMIKFVTPNPFIPALMLHISKDIVTVKGTHLERSSGISGYNLSKMFHIFLNLLINNSSFLLRLSAMMGVIFAFISIGLGAFFIYRKVFIGNEISGWTSLFLIMSFGLSLILITLGILGEYLIRIVYTTELRPIYAIRKKL